MKILHIVSSATMTGPADPALSLAATQRHALGHDVWIAYDQIREGNMIDKVPLYDVPVVENVSTCTKGGILTAIRDRKTIRALADDFDIIHCHSSHDHGLAALARGKATLVRSIHHPRSAQKRPFQSIAYHRTDGFIFVAEAHREQFLNNYDSVAKKQTTVVPGAVDTDWFTDQVDGLKIRDEFDIPREAFVIGMVARFQVGRGQNLLIEAFSRAKKRMNRPLILALIGKGETQAEMKACVKRYGIDEDTRFYGFRDQDLPEAIKSCDISVLLREGNDASCRAILQSLAVGVPVIGAKYAAIDDALAGTNFGRVIPPDDVHALESAILEMSESDLGSAGAEARQVVLEKYSELSRANAVELFYRTVSSGDFSTASKKKELSTSRNLQKISGSSALKKTEKLIISGVIRLASYFAGSRRRRPALLDGIRRVLILRIDERLGNVLLTTPLVQRICEEIPWAEIDWLVAASKKNVVSSSVNVIPFEKRNFFRQPISFFRLIWMLRRRKYDVVIDASHWHSFSGTSALLLAATGSPMRIAHDRGEARYFASDLVFSPDKSESELTTKLRLLQPLEIDPGHARMTTSLGKSFRANEKIENWIEKNEITDRPRVGLLAGSRKLSHRADPKIFSDLARAAVEMGAVPIFIWGPSEKELSRKLSETSSESLFAPSTDVEEFSALVRNCTVVIGNDTGTTHLSVALGTDTLGLFVKSDPTRWGHCYENHKTVDGRERTNDEILSEARDWLRDRLTSS